MRITEEEKSNRINKYIELIDDLAVRMELTNMELIYSLEQLKFETQLKMVEAEE